MGMFEVSPFDAGRAVAARSPPRVGSPWWVAATAAAIRQFGLADRVNHVSTGGERRSRLIELGDLPGLEALRGNESHV
jgi:phosphoglycerate kinase